MKEIKFRAWDKKENKMFFVRTLNILNPVHKSSQKYSVCENAYTCKNDFELMQFTGIKDKNGKEIYEGDIVYHKPDTTWEGVRLSSMAIVIWNEEDAQFQYEHINHKISFPIIGESIENKGNIYENPEMVKK